jgi:ATP-dependent Clp protease protease subunit
MKKFSTKKKSNGDEQETKETDFLLNFADTLENKLRVTGIYGDINEEKCSEAVFGMLLLDSENNKADEEETNDPVDFYVSTYGGLSTEMFAVYDVIRMVRKRTPIHTYGIGKVMSAGVLLLASGTDGERRIGRNCRVMIHGVISGQHGHLQDVENEFEEAKFTQRLYIKALAKETDMTERHIKKLMDRKTNVYIDAEKAVELGIADIVF